MESKLHFRLAAESDIPALIELVNAAYRIETFLEGARTDAARLQSMLQKGEILLGEHEAGALAGCVYMEPRGNHGYLGMFAVDPARQGLGLARRIIEAAEDRFRQQGFKAVEISVLSLRAELPPIYRRYGYVETGTEPFLNIQALKPGRECHAIVMTKQL
jgi:GNAT superfamily N-acetyltransferase